MSDKIFGLYLEQIAQRLSDDIEGLKEHLPSELTNSVMAHAPTKVWPVLHNLQTTQDFVDRAAADLMGCDT